MKKILLLFFAAAGCGASFSQPIIPRFENLGVNDGLAHSSVYSIYQDQKGFMWFGTPNGLSRYDGTQLQTFQFKGIDNYSTANNYVRGNILEDKNGNIWYSNESGIYKWDALKEKISIMWKPDKPKYRNSEFRGLYIDNNFLWMMNLNIGIIGYDITSGKMKTYPFPMKIDNAHLYHVFCTVDKNGIIWLKLGDDLAPVVNFDTKLRTFSFRYTKDPPYAVFPGNYENMLVYKKRMVLHKTTGTDSVFDNVLHQKNPAIKLRSGIKDSHGRWWMTTYADGLIAYNQQTNQFTQYAHDNLKLKSLPFNITTCVYIDRSDNLWIGTDGGGVARLNLKHPKFNLFPLSEGDHPVLKDYFIKCLFEQEDGRIWFGTHSNGLNIYDPVSQRLSNFKKIAGKKNSLPGNTVSTIFRDRDRNMWIGSNEGISLFDEKEKAFWPITLKGLPPLFPLESSFVFKMIQAKNGDILCATTFGLLRIVKNNNGSFTGTLTHQIELHIAATDIIEMPDEKIYIARPVHGILQLKFNGNTYDSLNTFLQGIDIRSISIDEKNDGYLWVGSGIGLIHFNLITGSYTLFNEDNGLSDNFIYGALQDSAGNLWISNNKGLSYFKRQNNSFENYSHLNGLQSNEFNTQAFHKSASGNFYFGGIKGFNWFRQNQQENVKVKPLAAITQIEINNRKFLKDSDYVFHKTISVPYYQNYFTFQFAALDFTMPEANKVEYILEGWDAGMITAENKLARYANLPPGNYKLRMRVSDSEGMWSDEEKLLIIINAPFWKTPSFILANATLLLMLIVYLTNFLSRQKVKRKMQRMEQQIAIDAERLRISADMHDEIGSEITHIALMSELMQTRQSPADQFKDEIKVISNSAHRLVQTMSEIIWALNPHNSSLENLLAYIREQAQQYFEPFSKQFNIYFPDDIPAINFTNEERRNLFLVTKELLNNALKHSNANNISLSFTFNSKLLSFMITDNGTGIQFGSIRPNANGIKNLEKRMKDIGGQIEWRNIRPGTEVIYSIPYPADTTFYTLPDNV